MGLKICSFDTKYSSRILTFICKSLKKEKTDEKIEKENIGVCLVSKPEDGSVA